MERKREKEKCKYVDKLDPEPRARYLDKCKLLNGFDPYDLSDRDWSTDVDLLPPLDFPSLTCYLVMGVSAYTLDEFRAYKSLEAHMQFTDGWVAELKTYVPEGSDNKVVKAKVLHSQRLNEKSLLPWVILDKEGDVLAAHCTCMAGLAETCTHVAALLFKLEAVIRVRQKTTVTGVPAYWKIPASVDKVGPVVGYEIDFTSAAARRKRLDNSINSDNMQPAQRQRRTSSVSDKVASLQPPSQERLDAFLDALNATGDRAVVLSAVPRFAGSFQDPVQPAVLPPSLRTLKNSKCDQMTEAELAAHCESVQHRVDVSKEEADKIERQTREQHKSAAWFKFRAGRITASKAHAVQTFRLDKPALSTVHSVCYPGKQLSTPAVTWGLQHEESARNAYIQSQKKEHFGFSVEKVGFVINPEQSHIGASPDGIIFCECCGKGCLEVKCTYKHRSRSVVEACEDKDFCLRHENGVFSLRPSHPYFAQVQCQLLVCEADYCDFVMKTEVDLAVVRVVPDEGFLTSFKEKARDFFQKAVLPELCARRITVNSEMAASKKRPLQTSPQKNGQSSKTIAPTAAKKKAKKLWCVCRKPEEGDMIACDSDNCKIEWFHVPCVGLEQVPSEDESWFCSSCVSPNV